MRASRTSGLALVLVALACVGAAAEPRSVEILPGPDSRLRPEEFFSAYAGNLGLGPSDALQLQAQRPSLTRPLQVAFYRQTYRGLPVEGGSFSLTLRDGFVRTGLGRVVAGLSAATQPRLSSSQALDLAVRALAGELRLDPASLHLLAPPSGELSLVSVDGSYSVASYRLAYRCTIVPSTPVASTAVDVDAVTGAVLALHPLQERAWEPAPAQGVSQYNGLVDLSAETDTATGQYRLRSSTFNTYDNRTAPSGQEFNISTAQDLTNDSALFALANQAPGVSVHWALPQANAFFQATYGSSCFSGQLGSVPDIASYLNGVDNAYFDPPSIRFFFGVPPGLYPQVALDMVSHELAHCVRHQVVPVPLGALSGEAAAVNESFADIFGEMVERSTQAAPDWIAGADDANTHRNLLHPKLSLPAGPDTYLGQNWQPGPNVHGNAGVQNRWFTLLALGDSGTNDLGQAYDVSGIGVDSAARIAYQGLTEHVTPDYPAARVATTQSAIDICGDFSHELIETRKAWYAVGLEPAPISVSPVTEPVDQATAVEPWPAKLLWQAQGTQAESEWDVEVSESQDFTANVHTYLTSDTTLGPNWTLLGRVDAYLEAGKTYYWRVRRHTEDASLDCFRPVQSFTTKAKSVAIIGPITDLDMLQKHHPWKLAFSWQPFPGIARYAVQVATDPSFAPGTLLFPERTVDGASQVELDVMIGKGLHWRVRPIFKTPNGEDVPGSWSQAFFLTSIPTVQLQTPQQAADVFPWPVDFAWAPVVGADRFVLDLQLGRGGNWGDPTAEFQSVPVPPSQTTYSELSVRADKGEIVYQWRVHVFGPSVPDASFAAEEGTPGEGSFRVTWHQTWVTNLKPGVESCPPVDQPFTFSWDPIPNASTYRITAAEALCTYDPQSYSMMCQAGPEFSLEPIKATGQTPQQATLIDLNRPQSSNGMGYYWRVQALGPGGLPGYENGYFPPTWSGRFLLQPDQPAIVAPANNSLVLAGEDVQVTWTSSFTPFGRAWAYAYRGPDSHCEDPPDWSFDVAGQSTGQSSVTLQDQLSDPSGTRHSLKVVPYVFNFAGSNACHGVHSSCSKFRALDSLEPPATPDVVENYYFQGGDRLLVIFSVVSGAESYVVTVHEGSPSGFVAGVLSPTVPQLVAARSAILGQYGLMALPQSWWIAGVDNTQPGTIYYYDVQACNDVGCSPHSGWSAWISGSPWPF